MINALTFDIEDYFQVEAFKKYISFDEWLKYPCRVSENTQKILDILDEQDVKATFFILGWIAEHFPDIIRKIADSGHEIASHGYAHHMVYKQSPEEFEADLVKSIEILEALSGTKVIGYRAPTYSIIEKSYWAFDILITHNLLYDSSIFPITHDRYGVPDSERFPYVVKRENGSSIQEFPLSTLRFGNRNFPIAGGGYMRLLPYFVLKMGLRHLNRGQQLAIIYLHPWELDPDQPKIPNIPLLTRFRHYLNLHSTADKLRRLIRDFEFAPVRQILGL
ncbi:polysaccharide deacetylase family protein [candidate division KSB3 bacterium]|uniref:Polysaccharide deacetylase family protein n=1 Tax=candidate division KSB3 bacterium TaxID=2044937 RepID=A0A2G6E7M9_9BACT|nr:MAG: polysaccharide deacetylase family protein [candidate division KSB3 bacterium]PIE30416.1 MAG: polysaccharide deacetylase family protein [candidate division KSB3 bacterium]